MIVIYATFFDLLLVIFIDIKQKQILRYTQKDNPLPVILNVVKDLLLNQAEADPSLSLRMTNAGVSTVSF